MVAHTVGGTVLCCGGTHSRRYSGILWVHTVWATEVYCGGTQEEAQWYTVVVHNSRRYSGILRWHT